ncbi:MAG: serine/threonine protein kinase [Myxococcales bacterium]|nr:serine/threonine protein kinase [Myxococcales bacterium]
MDPTEPLTVPPKAPDAIDPRVGLVLGERYRIVERIGTGGMGAVYRGEHITLKRRVAIKVLHPEMSVVPEVVERFEREARAAAALEHPNVVAVTDFGRAPDGLFYLVMEFIEGLSLRDALDAEAPFRIGRVANLARQMGSALAKAHALGIVHRDLKPENVMLLRREDGSEDVKVVDFGIAKVPASQRGPVDRAKTQAGMVYGTPEYMPPEQALGGEVGASADIYAMGVLLFEALTGRRPYDADDVVTLLAKQVNAPIPNASERRPGAFSTAVDGVLARMMAKAPGARYGAALEAVEAFNAALEQPLVTPAPTPLARLQGAQAQALAWLDARWSLLDQSLPPGVRGSRAWQWVAPTAPRAQKWAAAGGAFALLFGAGLLLGRPRARAVTATATPNAAASAGAPRQGEDAGAPRVEVHERLRRYLALPRTQEGMRLAEQGEYDDVARAFESVWSETHDGVVAYVLGRLAAQKRKHDRAVYWFDTTLHTEPALADDPELVRAIVRAYTEGRPEPGSEALLAGPLDQWAVTPLTDIALGDRPGEARTRAERLLRSAAFQSRLDPEARAVLTLRGGETCEQRRVALESLRTVGTARALPTLGALRVTRCRASDPRCNVCLSPALEGVKGAIRARLTDAGRG